MSFEDDFLIEVIYPNFETEVTPYAPWANLRRKWPSACCSGFCRRGARQPCTWPGRFSVPIAPEQTSWAITTEDALPM